MTAPASSGADSSLPSAAAQKGALYRRNTLEYKGRWSLIGKYSDRESFLVAYDEATRRAVAGLESTRAED